MIKLGLIGYPLSHSFSANYFAEKFEKEHIEGYEYRPYPLERIDQLPDLFNQHPEIMGLNVTIPYKEQVIPYLSKVDDTAKEIGAVNVIKRKGNQLIGYNSDYFGFKKSLLAFIPEDFSHLNALILGTGGASKAIVAVLKNLSIPYKMVSRHTGLHLTYHDLNANEELISQHQLIINCTPLGTYPAIDEKPDIPYHVLSSKHQLFDLVYNPIVTSFMKAGLLNGAKVVNGYQMLVEQAEVSWSIWQDDTLI